VIRLVLLGNVDLTGDAGERLDVPLRQSKRVALLAYLVAARPIGFQRRDKVAALFWPELPADRARAALRVTLSRLRDDFGAELIVGRGSDEIAVDPSQLHCDVLEFGAACESSRWSEAVGLYRGPFLDGVHVEGAGEELENWIVIERSRLRDELLRALGALGNDAEMRGDLDLAVTAARQALEVSPNDETLARRIIALLLTSGNRGAAMHAYDDFVDRLRADLGVEPAPETEALVAPLRRKAATPVDRRPQTAEEGAAASLDRARPSPPTVVPRLRRSYVGAALAIAVGLALSVASWIATHKEGLASAVPIVEWQPVMSIGRAAPAGFGSRAVLDSTGDALLVFGGVIDVDQKHVMPLGVMYWRLRGLGNGDAASWTRIVPAPGPHPSPRWLFGASSDAAHDRVIVHGGALGFTSPCANDTWVLNHASGIGHIPTWERVRIRGAMPPARAAFDQVLDLSRRRLIVFAGNDCSYPSFHDTWVLAFDDSTLASGTWSLLAPDSSAGVPLQRDAYTAAYDTAAGRLYIFGGRASGITTGELWALDHASGGAAAAAWRPITCAGEHPVLMAPASALDSQSDSWTFFGGADANARIVRSVWRLHGLLRDVGHCRWEQLVLAEPSPAPRVGASAALLAGSRGMVIFGGDFRNTPLADAWVLKPITPQERSEF
jgi:DNA-binding SARP family transcriptional activator